MARLQDVERWESPEGRRLLIRHKRTGEWWTARRLTEAEIVDAIATVERWTEPPKKQAERPHRPGWLSVIDGGEPAEA